MPNVGLPELIVILLVALLVVGPKRLPQLGRTIGKSLREFRRASDDFKQSFEFGIDDDDFPDTPDRDAPDASSPSPPPEHGEPRR